MKSSAAALFAIIVGVGTVAALPAVTAAKTTAAAQQRVHGTVVNTQGTTLTLKADDGRTLTVDMKAVGSNIQKALTPNEGVTVMGTPGAQPTQFTAQFIQQDSSDPSHGGKVAGQAAPATSGGSDTAWQRVHGTVASVSGETLALKTADGQTVNVDMKSVDAGIRKNLAAGEAVTVIGFYGVDASKNVDKKNLHARFIQKDSSASASPKTTK
ncbi:MAG TPA: hypothetical protein VHZ49_10690 [Methylomirabilota bacterium]|jgi:hypothetical protein|nr:hypothetical protein [Methylomirabilota bacterium]